MQDVAETFAVMDSRTGQVFDDSIRSFYSEGTVAAEIDMKRVSDRHVS